MDAIIRAKLGLDNTDWTASAKSSAQDATRLKAAVTEAAAGVALLEKQFRAAGSATVEQKKALTALRTEYATLKRDCEAAEAQVKKFNAAAGPARTNPYQPPTLPGRSTSAENVGMDARTRGMMLQHSARAAADSLLAGQSPFRAVTMEAPRLAEALGTGLAPTLGLLAGGLLVQKMAEAGEEAKKLQHNLIEAFAPLGGGGDQFQSLEALHEHITGIQGALKGMLAVQGTASHTLGIMFNDVATAFQKGGPNMTRGDYGIFQDRDEIEAAFNALRNDVDAEGAKMGRENTLKRRALSEGSEALTIPEIERKRDERIGDLRRSGLPDAQVLIAKVREQATIEEEAAARVHAAKVREVALESELLRIKREGSNVEILSARARVITAQATLGAGPQSGVEHDTNAKNAQAATDALEVAERTKKIHDDEANTQDRIANFRGTADQKHLFALIEEEGRLNRLLELYKDQPDARRPVESALAQNRSQFADFSRAYADRQDQTYMTNVEAGIGRGPNEAARLLHERQMNVQVEMRRNTGDDGKPKDEDLYANQRKQLHDLIRAQEDLKENERERLATIYLQTHAIKEQGLELTGEQKKKDVRAKYRQEIDRLNFEKRPDEAAAKTEQMNAELHNVDIDEAKMTPAQQRARDEHNRKRQYDEIMGGHPHTIDPSKGEPSFIKDSQGEDSRIPYAGKGPHSAYSSPDNVDIPDNANIPDNADIPDNAMPSFDEQDRMNVHPWDIAPPAMGNFIPDVPQAGNDSGNADLIAALQDMTNEFARQVITATTATV